MNEKRESVFWTSFFQQKKSLEKLVQESRADAGFYLFLSVSAFITTLGLLIDSVVVVIGGMLVAPLLLPILSLSMGITTSNKDAIWRSFKTITQAVFVVLFISVITTFLFNTSNSLEQEILLRSRPDLIFFLIAFAAGVAAAYAWVRQDLSAAMPGVAIAVTLLPPLSAIGIGIPYTNGTIIAGAASLFLINLFGITLAAMIIFSLFGFSFLQKEEQELIQEEEVKDIAEARAKLDEAKEKIEQQEEKLEEAQERIE